MSYKSILYLNNAAVRLLECECYEESVETFRDALTVKRYLYTQRNSVTMESCLATMNKSSQHDSDQAITRMIQKASKRVASLDLKSRIEPSSSSSLQEEIVILNVMDESCFATLLQCQPFIDQFDFALRIEDETHGDDCGEWENSIPPNWELNSAILLMNYAVAFIRASEDNRYPDEKKVLMLQEALNYFQYSYEVILLELEIFSVQVQERAGHTKQELETILRIVLVAMIIASQLSNCTYRCYISTNGDIYHDKYEKLSVLFGIIFQEYMSHPVTSTKHAAAA
jgi:hypothetical protein